MGTLVGHVVPGFGFFIIGLWHLFNNIKIHSLNPTHSSIFLSWFPTHRFKYLEPFLIMAGSAASVAMELFIGPARHQPLDSDGTIPSYHLHNFEHSIISITFFIFAAFSILLNHLRAEASFQLTQLLGAAAFAQELLLFHLHSADHLGPEGQYHLLLQLLVTVSLSTTLLGIGLPKSFMVAFVRSVSILFQGVWFMLMGFALWTPSLIPKGCFMHLEDGHEVVRCAGHEPLHRANSLINIQFSCVLLAISIFAVSFYLVLVKAYEETKVEYFSLMTKEEQQKDELVAPASESAYDVESQNTHKHGVSRSFIQMGNKIMQIDRER